MPVVTPVPDVLKSTVEYLKTISEITAIVSTAAGWTNGGSGPRISGALHPNWKVPTQAIVVRRAGGPGTLYDGRHKSRLDIWTYGSNGRESANLWRYVHAAICPPAGIVWTAAGCRVGNVEQEADPIPADDVDVGWSILITPYVVTFLEVPFA